MKGAYKRNNVRVMIKYSVNGDTSCVRAQKMSCNVLNFACCWNVCAMECVLHMRTSFVVIFSDNDLR